MPGTDGQDFNRGCGRTISWIKSREIYCIFFVSACKKGIQKRLISRTIIRRASCDSYDNRTTLKNFFLRHVVKYTRIPSDVTHDSPASLCRLSYNGGRYKCNFIYFIFLFISLFFNVFFFNTNLVVQLIIHRLNVINVQNYGVHRLT